MRPLPRAPLILLAVVLIAGCAPTVVVENKTTIPLRVVLSGANGRQILSTSPGESSAGEVAAGEWMVTVIDDGEWREYALATRKYLMDRLEQPESMRASEVSETLRRLKEVSDQLERFEQAVESPGATCSSVMAQDELTASAVITSNGDGDLQVECVAGKGIQEMVREGQDNQGR